MTMDWGTLHAAIQQFAPVLSAGSEQAAGDLEVAKGYLDQLEQV